LDRQVHSQVNLCGGIVIRAGFLWSFFDFSPDDYHSAIAPLPSEVCNIPEQAAHYQILALQFWGLKSDTVFGWLQRK
jgi:hypothetical protein